MASILRCEFRDRSTLFQKLDPSLQTSLLQKMHQIDTFESVVFRICSINQLLGERLEEFKSGSISTQEITRVYHEICDRSPISPLSCKRLDYYQYHLVSVLEDFYKCDLSKDEASSNEKIQESLQTCLKQYDARIEELKRAIIKASKIREAMLLEIEHSDNYLTILGKQHYPVDLPGDKTTIIPLANTYTFLIEDYSPTKEE